PDRDPDPRRSDPDGRRRRPRPPRPHGARLRGDAERRMRATAVVPVKRFAVAKSRLDPGVAETRKPELVAAMVADVLEAIGKARLIERTIVVSQEPRAAELAAAAGAELLSDFDDSSHSAAALAGIAAAAAAGAGCVAILPGDCPLLDP